VFESSKVRAFTRKFPDAGPAGDSRLGIRDPGPTVSPAG
jgi:hypothetical protein